jgi:hypothetical protein
MILKAAGNHRIHRLPILIVSWASSGANFSTMPGNNNYYILVNTAGDRVKKPTLCDFWKN